MFVSLRSARPAGRRAIANRSRLHPAGDTGAGIERALGARLSGPAASSSRGATGTVCTDARNRSAAYADSRQIRAILSSLR